MTTRAYRVVVALVGVIGALLLASPAQAESGDRISLFDIVYAIRADGSVDVVETIDYVFADSDRHGIFRDLITRQPYGDSSDRDVLYDIDVREVSSPNASADYERSGGSRGFRTTWTELMIGDPDETIDSRFATYRIAYRVTGAMRTVDGIPEFYWNATGNGWDARIDNARIVVRTPGGVSAASCFRGPLGSTQACEARVDGDVVTARATGLAAEEGVTVSVRLPVGSVRNAVPRVEPAGSLTRAAHLNPVTIGASVLVVLLSLIPLVALTRANRDRRYGGVAPGIVEPSARAVVDAVDKDAIPVRFDPPDVPPAVGGVLLKRSSSTKAGAAALTELAHAGAIRIEAEPQDAKKFKASAGIQRIALKSDLSRAPAGYAADFARALFTGSDRIELDRPGKDDAKRFTTATTALTTAVSGVPAQRGWTDKGGPRGSGVWCAILGALCLGTIPVLFALLQRGALAYLGPLLLAGSALIAASIIRSMGRRTPTGRALTDQVVGFRRYLQTAEARTLRFEEGRDIFSEFLPWAIMFGIADRWQKVCAELAQAGRIPPTPAWYAGPAFYSSYSESSSFGGSLSTSVSNTSSSGSGGSSGGGGGGGGGGSW